MAGAERGFKKPTFNPQAKLNVRFVGERGLDAGGPGREFMCLVMKEIRDSRIFHGDNSKFLVSNISAERDGLYHTYGKMLAYFLCHNGPAPSFLTDNMFTLLVLGLEDYTPTLDDVDPYVRAIIERIRTATTADEFTSAAIDIETVMIYIGGAHLLSFNKKEELVDSITNHAIKRLLKSAYEQFTEGLSCLGVLNAMRAHPDAVKPLFTLQNALSTAEQVINMTTVELSLEGSNRRKLEEETYAIYLDYLEHLEGKGKISNLLAFITGLSDVPPLGFDPSLAITFIHPEEVTSEHNKGVPYADTCANSLRLPVGHNYTQFESVMDTILFNIGNVFVNE